MGESNSFFESSRPFGNLHSERKRGKMEKPILRKAFKQKLDTLWIQLRGPAQFNSIIR